MDYFVFSLQLIHDKPQPTIALDNRYRLMRNEPMLNAKGEQTDEIGDDAPAADTLEEAQKLYGRRHL